MEYNTSLDRFIAEWFETYPTIGYKKGEVIISEDDTPEYLYCVSSGVVKVYTITKFGERNVLEIHTAGEIFSLPALLAKRISGLYYEAASAVEVRKMPKKSFYEALSRSHIVSQAVIWQLLTLLNMYGSRIKNLAYRSARERMASRLLSLAKRFGNYDENSGYTSIEVPLTHQELADSLSITRETATRVIDEFKRHDYISQDHHIFVIKNHERMLKIVE